jgi:hypothetical protein
LHSQLAHALKDVRRFTQSAFSGLHETDAVLRVALRNLGADDDGPKAFRNGKTRGVIRSSIDTQPA